MKLMSLFVILTSNLFKDNPRSYALGFELMTHQWPFLSLSLSISVCLDLSELRWLLAVQSLNPKP